MQAVFAEKAEKDLATVREALEQYREQAERLEVQKRLLLHQVCRGGGGRGGGGRGQARVGWGGRQGW